MWQFETHCSTAQLFPCVPNREWCIEMPGVFCRKKIKWHQFNQLLPFKNPTRRQNHEKLRGGLVTCVELETFIWHKLIRHVHVFHHGHLFLLRFHNSIWHNGDTQAFWHQCQSMTLLCINLVLLLHTFLFSALHLCKEAQKAFPN